MKNGGDIRTKVITVPGKINVNKGRPATTVLGQNCGREKETNK